MYKRSNELFDEVLKETRNCRCEYLEILIEKYVNTQDEVVDIDLDTFKLYKPKTNYLKKISKKQFGSVTSYECKSAKKTFRYLQKRILLQKRDTYRKYVGVESSSEEYHSVNSKRNLKYLSSGKVYKTLSVQENESSSDEECEESECNETELDDECHFISSVEESESILSSEDNPSFSSDTVKIASKKKQNKVFIENNAIKSLTAGKKMSTNNVQQFSNFEVKNCDGNLLKLGNCKQLNVLIENFSSTVSNSSDDKVPKIAYEKMAVRFKGISSAVNIKKNINSAFSVSNSKSFYEYVSSKTLPKFRLSDFEIGIAPKIYQDKIKSLPCASINSAVPSKSNFSKIRMEMPNNNSQDFSVSEVKSLPCSSNKSTTLPKSNFSKIRMETPNKNSQDFSVSEVKSLPCSSNKSTTLPKSNFSKIRMETSDDKNSQMFQNALSLKSASLLSSKNLNNSNSVDIDALSISKISNDRKPNKEKSLFTQSTLSFRKSKSHNVLKEYKEYFRENSVKIDDLSLKKVSNNRKAHKNVQKEFCTK